MVIELVNFQFQNQQQFPNERQDYIEEEDTLANERQDYIEEEDTSANERQDYIEEEDPLTLLDLQQIATLNECIRKRRNKEIKKSAQEVKFEAVLNDIYNERDFENGEELEFNSNDIDEILQMNSQELNNCIAPISMNFHLQHVKQCWNDRNYESVLENYVNALIEINHYKMSHFNP